MPHVHHNIIDFQALFVKLKFSISLPKYFLKKSAMDYSKAMKILEVTFPVMMHFFNLSIIEIMINARIFYHVESSFDSILFMMSISMIFQTIRKARIGNISGNPLHMIGFVSTLI